MFLFWHLLGIHQDLRVTVPGSRSVACVLDSLLDAIVFYYGRLLGQFVCIADDTTLIEVSKHH